MSEGEVARMLTRLVCSEAESTPPAFVFSFETISVAVREFEAVKNFPRKRVSVCGEREKGNQSSDSDFCLPKD